MRATLLDRLPADIASVLALTPSLAGIAVFTPSREPGEKAILVRVQESLGKGTMVESAGATGVCIWISDIEADAVEKNLPQVVLSARLRVTVMENLVLNRTGMTVLEVAVAIAGALHLWTPGENIPLVPDAPFFSPTGLIDEETLQPDPNLRGYELVWQLPNLGLETPVRTAPPSMVYNDASDVLTLSCSDGDAQIWYTLDDLGGVPPLPAPGEPAANRYSAPFLVAGGTTVRVACYADGCAPSQVLMATL